MRQTLQMPQAAQPANAHQIPVCLAGFGHTEFGYVYSTQFTELVKELRCKRSTDVNREDANWPNWPGGIFCESLLCPGNCSGAGSCDSTSGRCSCWLGATTDSCNVTEAHGLWMYFVFAVQLDLRYVSHNVLSTEERQGPSGAFDEFCGCSARLGSLGGLGLSL